LCATSNLLYHRIDRFIQEIILNLALEVGLRPIPSVGEAHDEAPLAEVLEGHLVRVLDGCIAEHLVHMAFVYEPEGVIAIEVALA